LHHYTTWSHLMHHQNRQNSSSHNSTYDWLHPSESEVYHFIKAHRLISPGEHVLLGVSGGPDSIAMAYILLRLKRLLDVSRYSVIHVNHGIRPEADSEEEFVFQTMKKAGFEDVIVEKVDVLSTCRRMKISIEMGARLCRHEAFERVRKQLKAHSLALAHHGNDQAEEILLRLFRGTGFEGLEGMRPLEKDRHIIRPLLCLSRKEILEYLKDKEISFVEDPSNSSPCFQRNRVRLELIPLAEDIFKRPITKILNRFADVTSEENDYWEKEITRVSAYICIEEQDGKIVIDPDRFRTLHVALQRRLIRTLFQRLRSTCYGITYAHIESVRKLIVESQSGRRLHIGEVSITKKGSAVRFEKTFPAAGGRQKGAHSNIAYDGK